MNILIRREVDVAAVDDAASRIDGDLHAFRKDFGAVLAADDAGDPQFAGNDSRVAGASAFVGDDRAGFFHGGDHVGIGHARHQHVAVFDARDFLKRVDAHHAPVGDARGCGQTANEHR